MQRHSSSTRTVLQPATCTGMPVRSFLFCNFLFYLCFLLYTRRATRPTPSSPLSPSIDLSTIALVPLISLHLLLTSSRPKIPFKYPTMSAEREYTFADVKEHQSKKDLWLVVHDKVYSCGEFIDEHPGGEEVLMDVAGQDATLAFEDVGHSDEAREILNGLLVGTLKRTASDPKATVAPPSSTSQTQSNDAGTTLYAFCFVAALVAFGAYKMYA